MRRAFAEALVRVAAENPRVVLLTGDLGFQVLDEYRARYGPRFINVGVAEAQLVCAAAGLAMEGWRPVTYSIASFATGRPFEQIRVAVNYPKLPVVIVGAGGGYTYANSGVTHHAADDVALMSILPNMTVTAPGDPYEVTHLLPQLLKLAGPSYLRLGRFGESSYAADETDVVLGRARLLRAGERVAILSTGDIASVVLEAVAALHADRIRPLVYQMHTVKPLDTEMLERLAAQVQTVVVVEEHVPVGGLCAAVNAWRAQRSDGPRIVRIGAPDALVLGAADRTEIRRRLGCDAGTIAVACRRAVEAEP